MVRRRKRFFYHLLKQFCLVPLIISYKWCYATFILNAILSFFFYFCYFHPFLWLQLNPHTSNFFIFDQYVLIVKCFFYILVHQCWQLLHISLWILNLCIFGQIDLKYQFFSSIKSLIELIQSPKFNAYFILVFALLILSFCFLSNWLQILIILFHHTLNWANRILKFKRIFHFAFWSLTLLFFFVIFTPKFNFSPQLSPWLNNWNSKVSHLFYFGPWRANLANFPSILSFLLN